MREILFRGKPKNKEHFYFFSEIWNKFCNDGFVYGSLIINNDRYFISTSALCSTNYCVNNGRVSMIEVIPETVGQFTGLYDSTLWEELTEEKQICFLYSENGEKHSKEEWKGKPIFEGDIIHCVSKFDSADMVVIFECGQFRRILAEKYHEHQTNVGYYDINCFAKEVIGNIHDNLELLKRG